MDLTQRTSEEAAWQDGGRSEPTAAAFVSAGFVCFVIFVIFVLSC